MHDQLDIIDRLTELSVRVERWRQRNETIALVPTMGALHKGHLSLVELAQRSADKVIVSIFVNPKQFGEGEDLDTYPRDLAGDVGLLAKTGADLVYAPTAKQIYPDGFSTKISVTGLSSGLCGASRPQFFDGIATVVTKLLLHCRPDMAIFGEKDYQQLLVIRRLARDLDLPVEIVGGPIIRESDGLALSSRNIYLSPAERRTAPLLHKSLMEAAQRLVEGQEMSAVFAKISARLSKAGFQLDYFELRDAQTLAPAERFHEAPLRLLIAAQLGRTRLIDNIAVIG